MPFLVRNISIGLDEPEDAVRAAVAKRLDVPTKAITFYAIVRRSLDARKKELRFTYQVEVNIDEPVRAQRLRLRRLKPNTVVWLEPVKPPEVVAGTHSLPERPVVVGFGPAGMFAALRLAQRGYRPIVLERGRDVRRRHRDVMQRFYRERKFNASSNLLFGEGGAGTYSDGKLYTRINDPLSRTVLETFYHHGADPDILIDARPHIGSDRLPTICTRIRQTIESLGGEVQFDKRLDDLRIDDGRLTAVRVAGAADQGDADWMNVGPTILAVGHSARDTLRLLAVRGVSLVPKPFQIGVRIEHPQAMVDRWQYGDAAGHQRLGPAEYHVVATGSGGTYGDVFSFCMCPGGTILPTNESPGLIATNGASRADRSTPFANSGLVITMEPAALTPMADDMVEGLTGDAAVAIGALAFQRMWEQRAFEATGRSYRVPAQRASDFTQGRRSDGQLDTSYPLGGEWSDIASLIPSPVADALRKALPMLDRKLPGYAGSEGIITAPETRASGPVRILRDKGTRQAVGAANLYPVGEGAGYAGGIVSAAVDGIKSADAIMAYYAPPTVSV